MEDKTIVVLGGGWVGTRFALLHKPQFNKIIVTSRNDEKVNEQSKCGFNSIKFDIEDEITWKNIPISSNNDISYIITFALDEKFIEIYNKLWVKLNLKEKNVFCLSTTSVYGYKNQHSILTESSPLTGLGVTGKPLTNRIKGEEFVLNNNATILHISGICGDEVENFDTNTATTANNNNELLNKVIGSPRCVKTFIDRGYFKNGLKNINLIHVNDICNIITILLSKIYQNTISINNHRINLSCGAFRIQDFVKALDKSLLPEVVEPIDINFKGNKIVSIEKLLNLIGYKYQWTLPITGVEPTSRGISTKSMKHSVQWDESGDEHDQQWNLMKTNFEGKWVGEAVWYKRENLDKINSSSSNDDGQNDEENKKAIITNENYKKFYDFLSNDDLHVTTSATNSIHNTNAALVSRVQSEYFIYFLDSDEGVWHGKGLRFAKNGEKKLSISRNKTNSNGQAFEFPSFGGQASINLYEHDSSSSSGGGSVEKPVSMLASELNFFYKRSRSMVICIWKLHKDSSSGSSSFMLDSLCITPFRCALASSLTSSSGSNCFYLFPHKISQALLRRRVFDLISDIQEIDNPNPIHITRMIRSHTVAMTTETILSSYHSRSYLKLLLYSMNDACMSEEKKQNLMTKINNTYSSSSSSGSSIVDDIMSEKDNHLIQSFDDDIICCIPKNIDISSSSEFEIIAAVKHSSDFFQIVTLKYQKGKLDYYQMEQWCQEEG